MRILPLLLAFGLGAVASPAVARGLGLEVTPPRVPAEHHADAFPPYYLWPFEVRVANTADVPLRIVRFGAQNRFAGQWRDPGRWFGPQEFEDWYTDGDPVEDGWIQPGEVAVDARSWNRSYDPMLSRSRWVYRAEDADGLSYEAMVEPEFIPHVPDRPNWAERGVTLATRLRIELAGSDPAALESAQVRVGRYPGGTKAYAVYHGPVVDAEFPVPGIYWLDVWAPGHERASLPLVLPEGNTDAGLRISMREHGDPAAWSVAFTGLGPDAADAVAFDREWRPLRQVYFDARDAYRQEHGATDGFEFETPGLASQLGAWIDDDARPGLARFAILVSLDSPFAEPRPAGERIFELLPFDSWYWSFGPHLAGNATARTDDRAEAIRRFAEENPDREVRARMLVSMGYAAKSARDHEELTRIVGLLESDYADVLQVQISLEDLQRAEKFVVGEPAPEFAAPTLDGEGEVSSSGLRGRYYLLHFWATWCGPCMAEMEEVHAAHERFAGEGLEFVSISMDRSREDVDRMRRKKWPMPWTNVYFEDVGDFEERFGISAIPAHFLIDPEGRIVAGGEDLRGAALEATLEEFAGPR